MSNRNKATKRQQIKQSKQTDKRGGKIENNSREREKKRDRRRDTVRAKSREAAKESYAKKLQCAFVTLSRQSQKKIAKLSLKIQKIKYPCR